jgi:hypothetical protein
MTSTMNAEETFKGIQPFFPHIRHQIHADNSVNHYKFIRKPDKIVSPTSSSFARRLIRARPRGMAQV